MNEPFIYGAQYFRAPTPSHECWEGDLKRMREIGFNSVKFWAQWRWNERSEGVFYWDDLDELMDLAAENGLAVTINIIMDVAPVWLFKKYPEAKMVDASGHVYEPCANICRQIGGYPGPCYNHPGALAERKRFVNALVARFAKHQAMSMWDVWNEPENNLHVRTPDRATLLCHCVECRSRFTQWLQRKYGDLKRLNSVWGRCYSAWDEIETPLYPETISDFIDWREFHLDKLSGEANWRLDAVKNLDPAHLRYLHLVSNSTDCFNAITCVDDFELAENCQVFGASMGGFSPLYCAQTVSAARGKTVYNAECHINYGDTAMHQRIVDLPLFLKEILPQIGAGIRGVLYWQFRSETLGNESPAWGLVRADGSNRPVTDAAERFWKTLSPFSQELMKCQPKAPSIGIWRGLRNEIFQFAIGQLKSYGDALKSCAAALYQLNLPFRTIASRRLGWRDLEGLRILIMPDAYFLDEADAIKIDEWLRAGGILIADAHLAAYNGTTGRHSMTVPGCGLAESWDLFEIESTSSFHLPLKVPSEDSMALKESKGDVAKALSASGASGSEFFPLESATGAAGFEGARRFAVVTGSGLERIASFKGESCVVSKKIGAGRLFYAGTSLGSSAIRNPSLMKHLIVDAAKESGVARTSENEEVHVDVISSNANSPAFMVLVNKSAIPQSVFAPISGEWAGMFSGVEAANGKFKVAAGTAEIFKKKQGCSSV